ncbi:MAG: metal-sulfur cluster assembly factor [Planctomycetota bacterium]|jgi:metal-sulfur cluster biosynthetic enzyme|nr:metal-sulfur cluster assembly factor [Planctomycetota bacterium]MDP6940633.1 metal-sulfur cluster assembly factor [Planctomycetota bacterium]
MTPNHIEAIREALREVYDPETGIGIVDMGLVYGISFDESSRQASIRMTLTTPACPMSSALKEGVIRRLERLPEVDSAHVEIVFEPPWTPELMSDEAKRKLGRS